MKACVPVNVVWLRSDGDARRFSGTGSVYRVISVFRIYSPENSFRSVAKISTSVQLVSRLVPPACSAMAFLESPGGYVASFYDYGDTT